MTDNSTLGPWRAGKVGGTVVSDQPLPGYKGNAGHDAVEYYGGHLIAESIWRKADVNLIASCPEMLEFISWVAGYADTSIKTRSRDIEDWIGDMATIASSARAAIAHATGEKA
ncbi:MAG: hypothetical protein WCY32_14555 [Burkholderiaceae bacterium]